jgi:hypothetical protein
MNVSELFVIIGFGFLGGVAYKAIELIIKSRK